jgi:hypothetical protein
MAQQLVLGVARRDDDGARAGMRRARGGEEFLRLAGQDRALAADDREDLIGEVLWEAFPEVVGSRFGGEYRRAMREQVSVHFEERYEPLGRTFEARAYPVSDGLAVYFTDVTSERASAPWR